MVQVAAYITTRSQECLRIFPGMFGNIPQNAWRYSPECLATFPGIYHSPIPQIPRIQFPVPVFLVLYIAQSNLSITDVRGTEENFQDFFQKQG